MPVRSASPRQSNCLAQTVLTGALFYDVDGIGGAAQTQVATLSAGLALTSADFKLVT